MKRKLKNNLNKTTSIVVNFYPATQKEISDLLKSLNITGVVVSNLISRWSVEVPFWKENYYVDKLLESELVKKIYSNSFYKKQTVQEDYLELGNEGE